MTAWLAFGALALILLAAAWFAKMPKGGVTMVATAIALAGAGYATQGQPTLAASPAEAVASDEGELAAALIDLRTLMDRTYGPHKEWLIMSDAALRRGNYSLAAAAIEGGLKKNPGNDELLNARALVLFLAADANLTPAVKLAFENAKASKWHPGPYYFEGLAHLSDRKPELTLPLWETAMTRGTPKGEWRAPVGAQLDALKNMMAQVEAAQTAQGAVQAGAQQAPPEGAAQP